MAIEAIIKRRVQQGQQAKQLVPLLMQLRAKAVQQPGYLSSETLSNIENPEECLVISRWQTIEDWNAWVTSDTRAAIQAQIDDIAGSEQEIKVYAPMVLPSKEGQRQGFRRGAASGTEAQPAYHRPVCPRTVGCDRVRGDPMAMFTNGPPAGAGHSGPGRGLLFLNRINTNNDACTE